MNTTDRELNPLGNLYKSFLILLHSIVIKYAGRADDEDTLEYKLAADNYIDAINGRDTFYTYSDYTKSELENAGITDAKLISNFLVTGDVRSIPEKYHETLLIMRRNRCIDTYEEQNNYYRMLNGYPDRDDKKYFSIPSEIISEHNLEYNVPLHTVQDFYNKIKPGYGDYLISYIESRGYIADLIERYPEKTYLKFIGSKRIAIDKARNAKNFEIIRFDIPDVKVSLIDEFLQVYEQCREYFCKVLYNFRYRGFFERYDNFMAMNIMLMTVQQLTMRQLSDAINRNFFDIYAVRCLYEAYDVPFNLNIDEDTQNNIIRNLNLLIQNKATDKVFYNIADLIGLSNIKIYRYYLSKERKFDEWGAPIVKYTTKFNTDTGELETVPDYDEMYDLYFHKFDIKSDDLSVTFTDLTNHIDYYETIKKDPFWFEDQNTYDRIWKSEFNFIESKYLSVGVSYSMTNIMFENVLLIKTLLAKREGINGIYVNIPKIITGQQPLYDVIILLLCLTSTKNNLCGEIISAPSQVVDVVDYIYNHEQAGEDVNTLKYNFRYFFNPDESDNNPEFKALKNDLINFINSENKNILMDNLQFNFDYFDPNDPDSENRKRAAEFIFTEGRVEDENKIYPDANHDLFPAWKPLINEKDYNRFLSYVEAINTDISSAEDKVKAFNDIFENIRNLKNLLTYYMAKITDNKREYQAVRNLYDTLFYSKEMASLFTITGDRTGHKRTAYTYFEYLYHINPKLYYSLYYVNLENEYDKYIEKHGYLRAEYSYDDFITDYEYGKVWIDFDDFKYDIDNEEEDNDGEMIYYYINHIIGRLELIINDIDFMHMIAENSEPLTDLLMKLIRFFKSYTVDVIDLDTVFVFDLRGENGVKFIEDTKKITKDIKLDEEVLLSYSDNVTNIDSNIDIINKDENHIYYVDTFAMESTLELNKYCVDKDELTISFEDKIKKTIKVITGDDIQYLYDTCSLSSNIDLDDKINIKDSVAKVWYTD